MSEFDTKIAKKLEEVTNAIKEYDVSTKCKQHIESTENVIKEHPIPSVVVGIGAGVIIGSMLYKYCLRE